MKMEHDYVTNERQGFEMAQPKDMHQRIVVRMMAAYYYAVEQEMAANTVNPAEIGPATGHAFGDIAYSFYRNCILAGNNPIVSEAMTEAIIDTARHRFQERLANGDTGTIAAVVPAGWRNPN